VLHQAGFTESQLAPAEERTLLQHGLGITNLVTRTTAAADELAKDELAAGYETLRKKVRKYEPRIVAVLGVGAYRAAFGKPKAVIGPQQESFETAAVWVLPNPSGLNAHYQLGDLVRVFRMLRSAAS